MDSSYVSSLELVNGQLQLNDETYTSLIQSQLQYLKLEAKLFFNSS